MITNTTVTSTINISIKSITTDTNIQSEHSIFIDNTHHIIKQYNNGKPFVCRLLHGSIPKIEDFNLINMEKENESRRKAYINQESSDYANFSGSVISKSFKSNNLYGYSVTYRLNYGIIVGEDTIDIQNAIPLGMGTGRFQHDRIRDNSKKHGLYQAPTTSKAMVSKCAGILHLSNDYFSRDSREKSFKINKSGEFIKKSDNAKILNDTVKHINKHWHNECQYGINEKYYSYLKKHLKSPFLHFLLILQSHVMTL